MKSDSAVRSDAARLDTRPGKAYLYLFTTHISQWTDGNIAGTGSARANADAMCAATKKSTYHALSCTTVRAALSINTSDEIRDMPTNYGVPTNRPVVSPTKVVLGSSWSDIMDGDIDNTLSSAGITGQLIWTGSNVNGSLHSPSNHCKNWTSNKFGSNYGAATRDNVKAYWLFPYQADDCSTSHPVLCLCW